MGITRLLERKLMITAGQTVVYIVTYLLYWLISRGVGTILELGRCDETATVVAGICLSAMYWVRLSNTNQSPCRQIVRVVVGLGTMPWAAVALTPIVCIALPYLIIP